jgi:hypothetical protein
VWKSIALGNNLLDGKGVKMLTTTTRNSGEMTTSLTNTFLSKMFFKFACEECLGYDERDFKLFVEGDDMICFVLRNMPEFGKLAKQLC